MKGGEAMKEGKAMRCPACGRHMLDRGTHLECPNILCDYEEDICSNEAVLKPKQRLPSIAYDNPAPPSSPLVVW